MKLKVLLIKYQNKLKSNTVGEKMILLSKIFKQELDHLLFGSLQIRITCYYYLHRIETNQV